ncbi:hypothetical protein [Aliiglaciecola sp. LCG003]|uniref:hypothetical protein n=1 Tax=Aliiglaciecola sp. LCG003 TaxID=3053655 RepID=UPI00257454C7|nr:hypothetical protein [Aliiglaciecola sp. LCG003]WJG09218.1 hypothetical protein QR722_18105 [Aliiglaciecola sp. LCG003]
MLISEAFSFFKATQTNVQWSVSAITENGELVASLWEQFFEKRSKNTMTYVNRVSRWQGAGNTEFIRNITLADKGNLPVRAIIAKTKKPEIVASGGGAATNLGNTFHPKKDWIGKIILWDGDNFEIEFSQIKQSYEKPAQKRVLKV